jgi:hypothetical protein
MAKKKIKKSYFFVSGKQIFFRRSFKVGVMQTNCIGRAATFQPNADHNQFLVLTAENRKDHNDLVTHLNAFFRDITDFFKKTGPFNMRNTSCHHKTTNSAFPLSSFSGLHRPIRQSLAAPKLLRRRVIRHSHDCTPCHIFV